MGVYYNKLIYNWESTSLWRNVASVFSCKAARVTLQHFPNALLWGWFRGRVSATFTYTMAYPPSPIDNSFMFGGVISGITQTQTCDFIDLLIYWISTFSKRFSIADVHIMIHIHTIDSRRPNLQPLYEPVGLQSFQGACTRVMFPMSSHCQYTLGSCLDVHVHHRNSSKRQMEVSWNGGTSKSSNLMVFSTPYSAVCRCRLHSHSVEDPEVLDKDVGQGRQGS